jgi:CheY-like chemotaxis protein
MGNMRSSDPQEEPADRSQVRRLHVLVVDDQDDIAETMAILIRLYGHEVDTASSGAAALTAAQAKTPDVVLLDISMPGMNGYDVAKQFRSMFGYKLLLIAITAYGSAEAKRRCLAAGFDDHFVKPVNPEFVRRLLTELAASFQAGLR